MDMTESIAPKSDQLNADDLIGGPVTVTISEVTPGTAEQPVNVHLVEYPGRPYRPSKTMRRLMVSSWGTKTPAYAGHRLTLYRNPETTFGPNKVGGIEISHMSGIAKPLKLQLTAKRGQKKNYTITPLPDAAPHHAGGEPNIPQQVRDTAEGITDAATMAGYADYLKSEGAPAHIIDYVTEQGKAL